MEAIYFRMMALVLDNPFPKVSATCDPTTGCSLITTILNFAYTLIGSIALLIIVIAGFQYVISRGDPQATAKARSTIIYAVVGLVIVLSAAVITNFVIGQI
jgi:type IV secretion system pilin